MVIKTDSIGPINDIDNTFLFIRLKLSNHLANSNSFIMCEWSLKRSCLLRLSTTLRFFLYILKKLRSLLIVHVLHLILDLFHCIFWSNYLVIIALFFMNRNLFVKLIKLWLQIFAFLIKILIILSLQKHLLKHSFHIRLEFQTLPIPLFSQILLNKF